MNKTAGKILSLILAAICIMTCFQATSFAAAEYTSGIYTYTLSGSSAAIVAVPETTEGKLNIPSTLDGYKVTSISSMALYGCTFITEVTVPSYVTSIGSSAFGYCSSMESISIPKAVKSIGKNAFANCSDLADVYYGGSSTDRSSISISTGNDCLTGAKWSYNSYLYDSDPYNLKDETYSFENYTDYHDGIKQSGHCFGMSMTSSGYYMGILDKSVIGDEDQSLYSFGKTSTVLAPIEHYHFMQGYLRDDSMVAGGSDYGGDSSNVSTDWQQVVNYVKDHSHDGKGDLQIGIRGTYYDKEHNLHVGGHAINFLRYEVVSGQERIVAYDNNFPDTESYFYFSGGKLYEGPKSTFNKSLTCITLRSVETYFNLVKTFDRGNYLYAYEGQINVEGAKVYAMDTDITEENTMGEYIMYEIPSGADKVTITPLVDNAEFEYCNKEYSFGDIEEGTCGTLTVIKDGGTSEEPVSTSFKIGTAGNVKATIQNISLYNNKSVNYYSTITFHPDYENVTDITWHTDGASGTQTGNDFTVANAKGSYKVWYTAKDSSGNEITSDVETVNVRTGILDVILSIIMHLFNSNAYVYDQR